MTLSYNLSEGLLFINSSWDTVPVSHINNLFPLSTKIGLETYKFPDQSWCSLIETWCLHGIHCLHVAIVILHYSVQLTLAQFFLGQISTRVVNVAPASMQASAFI